MIPKRKKWSKPQATIVRKLALIAEAALSVAEMRAMSGGLRGALDVSDRQFVRIILSEVEETLRRQMRAAGAR